MPGRLATIATSTLLTGCSLFGVRSGYEQPPYTVVETLRDDVEVRRYEDRLAAEATVEAESMREGQGQAFRILAGYIFGGNRSRSAVSMTAPVAVEAEAETIAMTVPVESRAEGGSVTMRFFLPSDITAETAPVPDDPRVGIVTVPPETVAVLRFSGLGRRDAVRSHQQELLERVAASSWRAEGDAFALFYDPPWTIPFLRRNEAVVRVSR